MRILLGSTRFFGAIKFAKLFCKLISIQKDTECAKKQGLDIAI